jgi:superfamily II DNA or RNA helicase
MASPSYSSSGSDLFIVDNSDEHWKVRNYLADWCELSKSIDIATGYFEIGAFLALKDKWQTVDSIRILMGDEVSKRTKKAFEEGLRKIADTLEASLESEKVKNDFLSGVPAIVEALRSGKIQCRVYRKDKFHAKCYLTHARQAVIGSFGLVGSSNFTHPGLQDNVELNVQIRGNEVRLLQDWFEKHWNESEEVTAEVLQTVERHTHPRPPFEVWFKGLHELLRGHQLTPDGWDKEESKIFKKLGRYQQDAYKNLMEISRIYGGGFLCDGVGLGKTYVGLMLIERLVVREGKRVVLLAPKSAMEDVWEPSIKKSLPHLNSSFVSLIKYNHTDLQRRDEKALRDMELTLRDADVILIDEAHHFRNPGVAGTGATQESRYRRFQRFLHQEGARAKQFFFLTATPINNSINDFRHILELVTNKDEGFFAKDTRNLGIQNLRSHFVQLEKRVSSAAATSANEAGEFAALEDAFQRDRLAEELVVQRSRAYVKKSEGLAAGGTIVFPEREAPRVAEYQLKTTYGALIASVEKAFDKTKPLFALSVYYPLTHWIGSADEANADAFTANRQKQVVTLIRTQFLKRFESSTHAFEQSCWRLLKRLLAWAEKHATDQGHQARRLERWKTKNAEIVKHPVPTQGELWDDGCAPEEHDGDFLSAEDLDAVEILEPKKYNIDHILDDTFADLDQLVEFLNLGAKVDPAKDDKLKALVRLLKSDKDVKGRKVLLFTEFADTARYLHRELQKAGVEGVEKIDGSSNQRQRSDAIRRFAPYYNGSSAGEITAKGQKEIRILIATDILAEGLNLQDANRLINFDLHWNPVKLMQRIGRVDRRMNPEIEKALCAQYPALANSRATVIYWNFLPPEELDSLLRLYHRVNSKTLVISRMFGIEGRQLLKPDDTFDPVREINEQYEGQESDSEALRLEYQQLVQEHPELAAELPKLPLKLFSGKQATGNLRGIFFCYRIPHPDADLVAASDGGSRWSESAGETVWLFTDLEGKEIATGSKAIADQLRCLPETPPVHAFDRADLSKLREKVEKRLKNDKLKPLQAPVGVSPILKCWMEVV